MGATPTTKKLGPEQARLRKLMRRLAEASSPDAALILSVYVDVRPEAHGERPAERSELKVVRHRLDAIGHTVKPHTRARESFDSDQLRIRRFLDEQDLDGIDGVALFACSAIGLWEVVTAKVEFETQVAAGPTADLFQLARMLDDWYVSAVVAIVDTNTCRLFVTRRGGLEELPGPDEPPEEHHRHDQGGWSQANYQRHIDMQDKRFAKEAAAAIERLVQLQKPRHVILAGDERSIPILERELSEAVRPLVDLVTHMQMRSPTDQVRREVLPIIAALEEADSLDVADRAVAAYRAGGLGVMGIDAIKAALEAGEVDQLVIDESAGIEEPLLAELVRQAALTDASVEFVQDHTGLAQYGGVGATLRFRT
jgi:peptide chain release factor subunit 1